MYLISTVNRNFDIIRRTFAMNNYSIINRRLEFKINISTMADIERAELTQAFRSFVWNDMISDTCIKYRNTRHVQRVARIR
ncbi:hypothetical protein V1478_010594 [Vespula squamosa]|uniref:Uncharacterized protein n=1 Tax=Vespula squamosa TaxID=30214 RepID=A0ABD2AI84_VESSQ